MTDLSTAVGTALRKRPRQLAGILARTAKSAIVPRLPFDVDARYEQRVPADPTVQPEPLRENTVRLRDAVAGRRNEERDRAAANVAGTIEFLNDSVAFGDGRAVTASGDRVDGQSLHWRLKFWGFEHLQHVWLGYDRPEDVPEDAINVHREWLSEWTDGYDIATTTGYLREHWMPHSVSLRILNWCRYDAWLAPVLPERFQRDIRRFAHKNAAFLSNNVEHGVGGNHLIENAAALIVAGSYFARDDWLTQGQHILERAATDQFFDDGGHVERSPMYHLIVTQRYLTSTNLLASTDRGSAEIEATTRAAVAFATAIEPPDGAIPLLNDSAFGEGLALPECFAYARACGVPVDGSRTDRRVLDDAGYHWLGEGDNELLAVAGPLAVPHIPAHAHVHPTQVLIWVDGRRVITDTGVYEYASGARRDRARSVGSHNTVQVGDSEPVVIGSSFHWVGNVTPTVDREDDALAMQYAVDGVGRPSYEHRRTIRDVGDGWHVTDAVSGTEDGFRSRYHLHPSVEVTVDDDAVTVTDIPTGTTLLTAMTTGHNRLAITNAPYYPEYGRCESRQVLVLERDDDGEIELTIALP